MSEADVARGFAAFHDDHAANVARYARAILGREREAELEDVLQEAWAKAWRAWSSSDPATREAWLFRIVRNCSIDRHRRGRASRDDGRDGPGEAAPLVGDIADDVVARIEADDAVRLLDRLAAPLRDTLWLRAVEERSYAEIAEIQGVPIGTVMSRLHAARRRLGRQLRGES